MKKEKGPNCYKCKHRKTIPGDSLKAIGNPHGIKSGWFMWPMNFDPIWLDLCNGFEDDGRREK